MPDVLDVIIILEDVEHLFHVGDVLGLIELLVVLRDHLDLRGLELDRDRTYSISNEIGEVRVQLPEGLEVDANCRVEVGSIDCPAPSENPDGPVLTLDVSTEMGSVKVTR